MIQRVQHSGRLSFLFSLYLKLEFVKNPKQHLALINFLQRELGHISYFDANQNLSDLTLNMVRSAEKSIIITYNWKDLIQFSTPDKGKVFKIVLINT